MYDDEHLQLTRPDRRFVCGQSGPARGLKIPREALDWAKPPESKQVFLISAWRKLGFAIFSGLWGFKMELASLGLLWLILYMRGFELAENTPSRHGTHHTRARFRIPQEQAIRLHGHPMAADEPHPNASGSCCTGSQDVHARPDECNHTSCTLLEAMHEQSSVRRNCATCLPVYNNHTTSNATKGFFPSSRGIELF